MKGRVLIIAGSDSGGGAGIQADIKTVTVLGGYAATAITALTAQNTRGVHGVESVSAAFIRQQIEVVLDDIGADCIKTGMLHDVETIETVADAIETFAPNVPLVVDPVMVAKGGAPLLQPDAIQTLKERLIPRATLITPNLPEAEALTDVRIDSLESMKTAAKALFEARPDAVILKGGRATCGIVLNVLQTDDLAEVIEHPRLETNNTHGSGCTLASACAAGLARGLSIRKSVTQALRYVRGAIEKAPGLGSGHGPLNHAFFVRDFAEIDGEL